MQGSRPKPQLDGASSVQHQKLKMPPLLISDDDKKPSELAKIAITQQEYPPLMQAKPWTKFVPFTSCKKKVPSHFFVQVCEGGLCLFIFIL